MRYTKDIALALVGVMAVSGPALAQASKGAAAPPATQKTTAPAAPAAPAPGKDAAEKDAAAFLDARKVSADGASAFKDIRLARRAIFEVDPTTAGKEIDAAAASLDKAKGDMTAFVKAEADLKPAKTRTTTAAPAKPGSTDKINWLPVDGAMMLGEDFVATPEKAKAVQDANQHFAKGDQVKAVETLRLADIDVVYSYAVAPLDTTMAGIKEAQGYMKDGKYYEANASLKKIEDAIRYDSISLIGTPQKGAHPKAG